MDSGCFFFAAALPHPHGLFDIIGHGLQISGLQTTIDPVAVYFDANDYASVHGDRERLGSPIPPRPPLTTILPASVALQWF